ncbi:HAMP domain-containing protein [bacterium]|nr:HAMP domain-containing protein [bacterium]
MPYRSFRRLLGETSLERKFRLLLGGGIFILILVSFFFYGYQTEELVWDQTEKTAEMLVYPVLLKSHAQAFATREAGDKDPAAAFASLFPVEDDVDELVPTDALDYTSQYFRPKAKRTGYQPAFPWERDAVSRLEKKESSKESRFDKKQGKFQYLAAITVKESCLKCHATPLDQELGYGEMKPGDVMAIVNLDIPLTQTRLAVNVNRAVLLSFAILTALAAMLFAYAIVRYVVVKPVQHLKTVSEEITAGNLDVRANIQTGDEFQELSHAFNRMLRSLVSMQDELRKVNIDLDGKLDELARANMALFEMNRLKSEFLATVSHELRTPLNSILGFGDLLAEVDTLDPKQKRWIQNIQTSGKNLLSLINDVLDLAKLEAGKMQVHVEEFSLRDVVEAQIQIMKPLADKKNIALDTDIAPSIPILRQDSTKLQQILSNLLSNAIKFTPEGGQIRVVAKGENSHVSISVVDNGVGIAPEDQKLIFEKFRQTESTLTRKYGGTGLGLSIVRELVKLLGGDEVQLVSELGRGSTFTIRLPITLNEKSVNDLSLGGEEPDPIKLRDLGVRYYSSKSPVLGVDNP